MRRIINSCIKFRSCCENNILQPNVESFIPKDCATPRVIILNFYNKNTDTLEKQQNMIMPSHLRHGADAAALAEGTA